MPRIDVQDRTWIQAPPAAVAAEVGDPVNWARWWPDLALEVVEDRGVHGVRWAVRAGVDRSAGSMEIWVQAEFDGTVLHYFLRLDPADGAVLSMRRIHRIRRRQEMHAKQIFWALKDRLEPARR